MLLTTQALPASAQATSPESAPTGYCHLLLTSAPNAPPSPATDAGKPKIAISEAQPVRISARQCEKSGDTYALRGDVAVEFGDYTFHGDTVTYNAGTGEAEATGNAVLDGGPRDVHISASNGSYNLRTHTGKFYRVVGTTGARFKGKNVTLTSSSPLAFTGKEVEQTGPDEYVLHHASVTSCELPHPKWTFNAATIILRVGNSARVYNTTFRLKGIPVFYLPYAAPPVERLGRQSGLLLPNIGTSSTKGTILGDSVYWAINRSADATLGAEFLSKRGWSLQEALRVVPSQKSFINLNYFQVLDRGIAGTDASGKPTTIDQGGEDIKLNAESEFAHGVRGVATLNYLSSFIFRLAFTENFSQAVNSEVKSDAFLSKSVNAFSLNAFTSRYQNFQSTVPDDVITILHTPGVEFSGVDQPVLGSWVYGGFDVDAEGLRRSEPNFVTSGLAGRFDLDPDLSLPLLVNGWTLRPEVQLRNTVYSQQQAPSSSQSEGTAVTNVLNRRLIDATFELRPPALIKVFDHTIANRKLKHTIEPRMTYQYVNGIEDFSRTIRFDLRDILSNTNEVEYALTQRLYLKRAKDDCAESNAAAGQPSSETPQAGACAPAGADEFLSWEVKQKYFIDPNFGGAVINGRRNVLSTTVDFAGIAFLTDPRRFSPIVSRIRMRTTANSDMEWELDYDTKKGRINASTFYSRVHFGDFFVEASHAYLQVPGEIVTSPTTGLPLPQCSQNRLNQLGCVPSAFNQIRALLGYGSPSKKGWSAAANVGIDSQFKLVQYSAAQAAYNWDCCGLSFEYRRFSLGPAVLRNENQYRFAFTLANIGTFGNLKKQARLF
ncbi:MAG TPA: LPS assembly protein LptD [Terriglobales bacterium]|nr:LPS assembly protein LptD [Terriglobales bacterium]